MTFQNGRTAQLAGYAAQLNLESLAPGVGDRVTAKVCDVVLDTCGVLLAASRTPEIVQLADLAARRGTDVGSGLVARHERVPAEIAAFVNGAAGHHIELDDSHGPSLTHPAAVIVPSALAAAGAASSAGATVSGSSLLAAIVAGYDVSARVSQACGVQSIVDRSFHATSVCGTIGAAAAAGRVLGFNAEAMTACLGLAASQSSGLLTWEDDPTHVAKSFQTGIAARSGVFSALLAETGYAGSMDALAGRYNLLAAFGGAAADADLLVDALGERYEILNTDFKRFASCRHTHAPVDAVLDMMTTESLKADEIESVDVWLPHSSVPVVDRNPLWTHNLQYVVALAITQGAVLPEHFASPWTEDERVLALADRVRLCGSDELEARYPAAKGARVILHTSDRRLERNSPLPVGHRDNPIPPDALRDKFEALSEPTLGAHRTATLGRLVSELPTATTVAPLLAALCDSSAES